MKRFLKRVVEVLAALIVLPAVALCRAGICLLGPERGFAGWSQLFALIPGLAGVFLRRAFYRLVLPRCGTDCCLTFGTILSHPTARIGDVASPPAVPAYDALPLVVGRVALGVVGAGAAGAVTFNSPALLGALDSPSLLLVSPTLVEAPSFAAASFLA
mgnify:CR=1 FL=1